ncbi:MAG: cyclin-dependent kinase inhibitor 3 family protein [Myxococcota bacterium]
MKLWTDLTAKGTPDANPTNVPAAVQATETGAPLINPADKDAHIFTPLGSGLAITAPKNIDTAKYRTDPLKVDWVDLHTPGKLGMSLLPGKGGPTKSHDARPRHLGRDLDQLHIQQKIDVIVSLIEAHEFASLGVPNLIGEATARGMTVDHFPIPDVNVPKDMAATAALIDRLVEHLKAGDNILVHCRGGLGRTGTIAACVLVALGFSAQEAIDEVRKSRPGTLETSGQESFVSQFAAYFASHKAAATPEAGAAQKPKIEGLRPDLDLKFEDLIPAGAGPTGSNPGGWFKQADGTRFYVKTSRLNDAYKDARIQNEILASKLYELAGIEVPQLTEVRINGTLKGQEFKDRLGLASKIIEGLHGETQLLTSNPGALPGVFEGFGTHCWLSNWDVIGLGYDNTLAKTDGDAKKAVCIEVGGALLYRAMGEAKGQRFGNKVGEIETLLDPKIAPQASQVYKHMTAAQIEASMVPVLRVPDDKIRAVVDAYGPGDEAAKKALADTLIARKQDIASRFPNAVKMAAETV